MMKNFFGGGKIWTILAGMVIAITCGLSVYAVSQTAKPDFSTKREKSSQKGADNNILTAEDWNGLMDALNERTVPEGAIIAFEGSCPTGWIPYTSAEGRFIIGANSSYPLLNGGGSSDISLTTANLPSHNHYIAYDELGKGRLNDYKNATLATMGDVQSKMGHSTDKDTYYNLRYSLNTANAGKTSSVGEGKSINIMPPYIALNWCIKQSESSRYPCKGDLPGSASFNSNTSTNANTEWSYSSQSGILGDCKFRCNKDFAYDSDDKKCHNVYKCCQNNKVICGYRSNNKNSFQQVLCDLDRNIDKNGCSGSGPQFMPCDDKVQNY